VDKSQVRRPCVDTAGSFARNIVTLGERTLRQPLRPLLLLGLLVAASSQAQQVTECDRLTAHPLDPDKITIGVPTSKVPHDEGIAACKAAVAEDPDNPRLNYQLGRVYFYADQTESAIRHLEQAAGSGHRQAQFVLGAILRKGSKGTTKNICRTEDLWLASARAGRLAAQVSYPHYLLKGQFQGCDNLAPKPDLLRMLESAQQRKLSYYQTLLITDLIEGVNAL
jgi:tetratricopeptide (TPR) repeat protein